MNLMGPKHTSWTPNLQRAPMQKYPRYATVFLMPYGVHEAPLVLIWNRQAWNGLVQAWDEPSLVRFFYFVVFGGEFRPLPKKWAKYD